MSFNKIYQSWSGVLQTVNYLFSWSVNTKQDFNSVCAILSPAERYTWDWEYWRSSKLSVPYYWENTGSLHKEIWGPAQTRVNVARVCMARLTGLFYLWALYILDLSCWFRGCSSGGVYVPCIYSHAGWRVTGGDWGLCGLCSIFWVLIVCWSCWF